MQVNFAAFKALGATDLTEVALGAYRMPSGQRMPCIIHTLHQGLTSTPNILQLINETSAYVLRLRNPHIASMVAANVTASPPSVAYEYLPGVSLRDLLVVSRSAGITLSPPMAVSIAVAIARALAALHGKIGAAAAATQNEQSIVMRMLSPHWVRLGTEGEVQILGAAFAGAVLPVLEAFPDSVLNDSRRYLAPEVLGRRKSNNSADIYSLGVILWEALALRDFTGKPLTGIVAELPPALTEIVDKCLQTDPSARPVTADDVAHDLATFLHTNYPRFTDKQLGVYISGVRSKDLKIEKSMIADALTRDDLLPQQTAEAPRERIIERQAPSSSGSGGRDEIRYAKGRDLELTESAADSGLNAPQLSRPTARNDQIIKPPQRRTPNQSGGGGGGRRPQKKSSPMGMMLFVLAAIAAAAVFYMMKVKKG